MNVRTIFLSSCLLAFSQHFVAEEATVNFDSGAQVEQSIVDAPFSITLDAVNLQKEQIAKDLRYNSYLRMGTKVAAIAAISYCAYRYMYGGSSVSSTESYGKRIDALERNVAVLEAAPLKKASRALKGCVPEFLRSAPAESVVVPAAVVEPEKIVGWFQWGKGFALDMVYHGATAMAGEGLFKIVGTAIEKFFHDGSMHWFVKSRLHLAESASELQEYVKLIEADDAELTPEKREYYCQCMAAACKRLTTDVTAVLGFMQYKKDILPVQAHKTIDSIVDYLFVSVNAFGAHMQKLINGLRTNSGVTGMEQSVTAFKADLSRMVASFARLEG